MNNPILFRFKLTFLVLLFLTLNVPVGQSNIIYSTIEYSCVSENIPPPVEKVKPPVDKKKKAKKNKQNRKQHFKFKSKKKISQTQDVLSIVLAALIALFILNIAGAFMFGFGLAVLGLWLTGLIFMGLANTVGVIFSFLTLLSLKGGEGVVNNVAVGFFSIFLLIILVSDFIIGLSFFIWGLVISLSLVWIVGIVLLAIALFILIAMLLTFNSK